MQRAVPHGLAVHGFGADEIKDFLRRLAQQAQQAFAHIRAKRRDELFGHDPHAGIDQTDIATGTTIADLDCLGDGDALPRAGQMQRRREARITRTDDRHIHRDVPVESPGLGRVGSGEFPNSVALRVFMHGV